jgi:curved DNA-binding protein CbpA
MADTPPESGQTLVELIVEKHLEMKTGDYFALLGVPRTADTATIKNAYFVLAKQLHPDVIARQNIPEVSRQAVEVFKGLSEAFAVLTDRRRRLEYEAKSSDGKPTVEEKTKRDAASEAKIWYHKGMLLLQRRAHAEAEACLRKSVELDKENPKMLDALGWAVMNNEAKPMAPRLEEARQWFERAMGSPMQDQSGDPYYYMALYHKARGELGKQRTCLMDCLAVNPRNVDAVREQRLLSMRARKKNQSNLFSGFTKLIDNFKKK